VIKVKKYGIEMQASKVTREPCGRCGAAIEENAFCPACRDFFCGLSGQNAESTKVGRGTQNIGPNSAIIK
jgi:hypothetical protein